MWKQIKSPGNKENLPKWNGVWRIYSNHQGFSWAYCKCVLRLVLGKNIQDFEEIRKNIKSDALDVLKVPYVHFSAWYWLSTYYLGWVRYDMVTWTKRRKFVFHSVLGLLQREKYCSVSRILSLVYEIFLLP